MWSEANQSHDTMSLLRAVQRTFRCSRAYAVEYIDAVQSASHFADVFTRVAASQSQMVIESLRIKASVSSSERDVVIEQPCLLTMPQLCKIWKTSQRRTSYCSIPVSFDTVWLTDDRDHTVRQCTLEGKVLLTLGISGKPAPYMSGEPFHRCTHTAMSPQGDIYVSDGYGNSRVHKYAPNGKLLFSWGGPGTDPGEFNIAHNITCDADGWVYVADRENHRVQVFDGNGKYETQWNNLHRPCGLFMPPGKCPVCYIGELGAVQPVSRNVPNLGPRVTIVDNTGQRISRLGGLGPGLGPTEFLAPHGLTVDSRGDLYIGEVSWTNWPQTFRDKPRPDNLRSLHKFRKVG